MKLSNLSVIFIVIAIPLILILSYYLSLQRDTINMQTAYNTKLLDSTKEAIEAFEINTVEWNEAYSETADSKRRDIMASINTFTTSLANNLGVSGTSKEYLLAHIPAIAFTLYDGCYIYSPSETKFTVKNEDGVTQFMSKDLTRKKLEDNSTNAITGYTYDNEDDGKILYQAARDPVGYYNGQPFTLDPGDAATTVQQDSQDYPHILKPFTAYSESVTSGSNKMVINYTLDNYVTIYGDFGDGYTSKAGYLNITSSVPDNSDNVIYIKNDNFTNKSIDGITFSGQEINKELLSETIAYKDLGNIIRESFNYVYESEKDTKVYYDESIKEFFRLNNDLERVYVKDLPSPLYKKCTIPVYDSSNNYSYIKIYQSLVTNEDGTYTWYVKNDTNDTYTPITDLLYLGKLIPSYSDPKYDYSAINYCVETYVFTNLVNDLRLEYSDADGNRKMLNIADGNDPEKDESEFTQHKRKVIRGVIESNLNQAITSYSRNVAGEYRLPILKETEWDQVLSNVSIITFLQNIPIGLKYYNNYAIATSTFNKEYVDPDEIYIYDQSSASDLIYHSPYCDKLSTTSDLIGYRSIDYMYKNYEVENAGNKETKYYFKHTGKNDSVNQDTSKPVNQSCYYCLVQRALYNKEDDNTKINLEKDAYYTALARERYLQLDKPIIEQEKIDITVTKNVDSNIKKYGDSITYTISVKNNSTNAKIITIEDEFSKDVDDLLENITVNEGSWRKSGKKIIISGIKLEVGEIKNITITAKVKGAVGRYSNTAKVLVDGEIFESNPVIVTVVKDIEIVAGSVMKPANIVFIIDASASMVGTRIHNVQNAVSNFVNKMTNDGKSQIGYVKFYTVGLWFMGLPYADDKGPYMIGQKNKFIQDLTYGFSGNLMAATPFATGLKYGKNLLQKMKTANGENINIAIFLSDGVNFYLEIPHYTERAKELQSVADRVYAIGYKAELATNFGTLKYDIASDEDYFKESNNMEEVFTEIFNDIVSEINENIDGSILIESTEHISGTASNMQGNWISLKNDSEYDFSIDSDDKMNGIDINSTKIGIQVNGTTIKEDTLVGLSNERYIGKAYGSVYLNLDKFAASDQITIEVVK